MEENRFCEYCGAALENGASRCKNCGNEAFFNETKGSTRPKSYGDEPKRKQGPLKVIVIILICIFLRTCIAKIENVSNESKTPVVPVYDEFEEHASLMEKYKRGYTGKGTYTAPHFGFHLELDDNWTEIPQKDLEEYEKTRRKDAIDEDRIIVKEELESKNEEAKKEDIEEVIEKWEKSYHFEVEYGATFSKNNEFAGEITIITFSSSGLQDVTVEKYVENIKNSLKENSSDVTTGYETLGNYVFNRVQWNAATDSDTVVTMLVRKKGAVLCRIECRAPKKYSEELLNSLKENISGFEVYDSIDMDSVIKNLNAGKY